MNENHVINSNKKLITQKLEKKKYAEKKSVLNAKCKRKKNL